MTVKSNIGSASVTLEVVAPLRRLEPFCISTILQPRLLCYRHHHCHCCHHQRLFHWYLCEFSALFKVMKVNRSCKDSPPT